MTPFESPPFRNALFVALAVLAMQVMVLVAFGQPPICACGTIKLWHGTVLSAENSQHIADWYSFTHVLHGLAWYLLLWRVAPGMPLAWRFALAVGIEAGWEILENSPFIIARYRQTALAQGYAGDSIVNSVSDTLFMALGFGLARKLPVLVAVALTVAVEVTLLVVIRDNLTLNIVQLIHPFAAISRWQAGG